MLHNTIHSRAAKNPQRLEPQGLADFAFYAKHGHNLYYTPVFTCICYRWTGVFLDGESQNEEKSGCCTHNNTPRNATYCHTAFPTSSANIFPPLPHPHFNSPQYSTYIFLLPPILFAHKLLFLFSYVTVANIYNFFLFLYIFIYILLYNYINIYKHKRG